MEDTRIELPQWETLPDIGLYMDQVITLMERTFAPFLPGAEITKSMVNNYVKVELIPRPIGKKYDREHLALLLVNGTLPEKCAFPVTAVLCVLATACGGVWAARGTSLGPLPAALLAYAAGIMAAGFLVSP